MRRILSCGLMTCVLVCVITFPLFAKQHSLTQQTFPTPLGYVSDYADILSPQWHSQIRSVCKDLENRTGIEMIVVTMDRIDPTISVHDYASRLYEGWRIGTAQQQRGILLLTAVTEGQAVVVLGRSLLSVISRQQLNEISKHFLVPMYQTKDYGQNMYRAVVNLASTAAQSQKPLGEKKKSRNAGFWMNLIVVIIMLLILWRFTKPERRHPFQRWRRGEYWGTGQGGFGGNFGGFGGGMGGQGLG